MVPMIVSKKLWKNTVKEAFKNDPLRILIELIKNSADSYTRLIKKKNLKAPYKIQLEITCKQKNPPRVVIRDFAEGMDSKKLKVALKYGTPTSRTEDIEASTSAEKGIGLKDALMALNNNWLITIKDGLINERKKQPIRYKNNRF